jgi:hypothetical protein
MGKNTSHCHIISCVAMFKKVKFLQTLHKGKNALTTGINILDLSSSYTFSRQTLKMGAMIWMWFIAHILIPKNNVVKRW